MLAKSARSATGETSMNWLLWLGWQGMDWGQTTRTGVGRGCNKLGVGFNLAKGKRRNMAFVGLRYIFSRNIYILFSRFSLAFSRVVEYT